MTLFPHNKSHCGHGPVVPPPGLEDARKKLKERQLSCGNCSQKFTAICALHVHLKGDSYHYDKETLTAHPLDENSCPATAEGDNIEAEAAEAYFTETGERVMKMKKKESSKRKVKSEKKQSQKPDKIIDIQIYPKEDDKGMVDSPLVDPANVDLEFTGSTVVSGLEKSVESYEGVTAFDEPHADDVSMDIGEGENFDEPAESIETSVRETAEPVMDDTFIPDQQTLADLHTGDIETQTGLVMNKQMVIDLHSMETNEDGSLKIVVGEKDAAVFKTPQGEEILKALKAQGKGLSAKNTQIIYNYTVPISLDQTGNELLAGSDIPAVSESLIAAVNAGLGNKSPKKKKIYKRGGEEEDVEMATGIDGLEAIVFMRKEEKLTTTEAIAILEECSLGLHDDKISKIQPLSAKGGDVYVVDLDALPNRRDIRHDKYYWYNCGQKTYPKNQALIRKYVFKIRLPNSSFSDAFIKSIYQYVDEKERYCVVHYTGFESIFKPFPHGNSKTGKSFVRTCPSVIEELKEMANKDVSANEVHKQVKSLAPPTLRGLRTPRNLDQIKNHFFYAKKKKVLAMKRATKRKAASVIATQTSS